MRKYLFQAVAVVVLATSCMAVTEAQVFNPTTPQAAAPQTAVQQAGGGATSAQAGAVERTGWAGIPMPKITMPKVTMPKITMPSMASVTGPVKSGFGKVTSGTKKAWEGTKEMLSFGQNKSARASNSQQKASFWQRLIAKPEPQVPQTVGEFMRQPRIDP